MKPDLTELEELAKKATQGEYVTNRNGRLLIKLPKGGFQDFDFYPETAEFVAVTLTAFPSILQTIRCYEEVIERVREWGNNKNEFQYLNKDFLIALLSDLDKKLSEIA